MQKRTYQMKYLSLTFLGVVFLLNTFSLKAQIGTPKNPTYGNISSTAPPDYYNELIGLDGTILRNKLQTIVVNENTKGQNYGDVWDMLEAADENPLDNTEVWLIYTETTIGKTEHVVDNTGWNREHIFPQSRGGFADGTSFTADGIDVYFSTTADDIDHAHGDAHHIRACLATENTNRGDLDFDNVDGPRTKDTYFYEPPLSAKGDVARALFYMAIRYNDLSLGVGDQDGQTIGNLTTLLEWNKLDPPDDYEMRRNNVIYEWQNNRNPFIDNPDLADYIWGDKKGQTWLGDDGVQIIISGNLSDFGTVRYGDVSSTQSYTVEASKLTDDLQILAPDNFEIALSDTNDAYTKQIILQQTDSTIESTTIYVRFKPDSTFNGGISDYITHTTAKTVSKLNVTGTEGDPLKEEDTLYTQNFDTDCASDWVIYSVSSNEDWFCDSYGLNGTQGIKINNYQADDNSEDWFISPQFDISGHENPELKFWLESTYEGSTLELYYSIDYIGSGDPNVATWTKISDVNLSENWEQQTFDLSLIGQDTFYVAYKHTSTSTSASRINMDNIELVATPIVPEMNTDVIVLNFPNTAPGNSSPALSYTISCSNLQGDVSVQTTAPFELSLDNSTWTDSISVSQADAASATIYVRFSPTENYLKGYSGQITHSTLDGTNLVVALISDNNTLTPDDADTLSKDSTLDIVTWNLEWFGAPEKSNHATTWDEQLSSVSSTILNTDADIYALQEVVVDDVNGNYLDSLLTELNNVAGADTYSALLGPRYSNDDQQPTTDWPAQRVCYIFKTAYFSNISSESMFSDLYPDSSIDTISGYTGDASLFWASGRLPFLFKADVTINGVTETIDFINIHAKCCTDSKDRRIADALFLKDELDKNFDTENVIVLGDYNDYCEGSISGGDSPYISWFENTNEDYYRAIGASIDHISISNELYFENQSLTNNGSVTETTISDHDPVMLRIKLEDNNLDGQIIKLDEVQNVEYNSDPFFVHAQSSANLPVEYEIVSGPASISGSIVSVSDIGTVTVRAFNSGDINILPAADTILFNVIKASQIITFDLPAEVLLSQGSIVLSATSSSGLDVGFNIVSGGGTISGDVLSFTEAGDISIEAYQPGDDKYNPAPSVTKTVTVKDDNATYVSNISNQEMFSVYPNPAEGTINIDIHDLNITNDDVLKIFTIQGKQVRKYKLNSSHMSIDLSGLKTGVYILIIETKLDNYRKVIILK